MKIVLCRFKRDCHCEWEKGIVMQSAYPEAVIDPEGDFVKPWAVEKLPEKLTVDLADFSIT